MANPTRYKGSGLYLSLGLTQNAETAISGIARGLDTFSLSNVEDQRDVPGGGDVMGKQALGYREGNAEFTVDENETTRPLFWGKNARRFYCTYGPEGNASGSPKFAFEAIATITHNWEERAVRRFQVSLAVDGDVDEGTF